MLKIAKGICNSKTFPIFGALNNYNQKEKL
jgi:hypothetical protein